MNHLQDTIIKDTNLPFIGRRQARILAVQCLYNMALVPEEVKSSDDIISDILIYGVKENEFLDQNYFLNIVKNTYKNVPSLHKSIQQYLSENWKISRLSEPIQAILLLAAYEIIYNLDIPIKILINEYIEITKIFNHESEAGFINSVLDKIAKEFPRV